MDILILKQIWGEKILSGEKTWEIRSSNTSKRGKINIAYSKTSSIYGKTFLIESMPLTEELFVNNRDKHCIDLTWTELIKIYKHPYVWVLNNSEKYNKPIKYNHPKGAVVWVKK